MKTKAVISLSEDDYYYLVYTLGVAAGHYLRNEARADALKIQTLYRKISESVKFAEDHEK